MTAKGRNQQVAGRGTLLAAHGPGPRAQQLALEVCSECRRRSMPSLHIPTEQLDRHETHFYELLILIVEGPCGHDSSLDAVTEQAARAIERYREQRRHGLVSIWNGTIHPTQAGILHVVAPDNFWDSLSSCGVTDSDICLKHDFQSFRASDLFAAHIPPVAPVSDARLRAYEELEPLWRLIRDQWSLPDDVTIVPILLDIVMRCRDKWEADPRRTAMYRPLAYIQQHENKNRFDLILEPAERDEVDEKAWKSYQESGAFIVRPDSASRCSTRSRDGDRCPC